MRVNKFEIGMPDVDHDIRTLQEDKLGAVIGGLSYSFGVRQVGVAEYDASKNEVAVEL